jgi:hypothetical protein
MLPPVLFEIAFLGKVFEAKFTSVRFDPFMHPNMVENIPSLGELFVAIFVFANVEESHWKIIVLSPYTQSNPFIKESIYRWY